MAKRCGRTFAGQADSDSRRSGRSVRTAQGGTRHPRPQRPEAQAAHSRTDPRAREGRDARRTAGHEEPAARQCNCREPAPTVQCCRNDSHLRRQRLRQIGIFARAQARLPRPRSDGSDPPERPPPHRQGRNGRSRLRNCSGWRRAGCAMDPRKGGSRRAVIVRDLRLALRAGLSRQ